LSEQLFSLFEAGDFRLPVGPVGAGGAPLPATLETIAQCPALACTLFRAANSAYYQGLPKAASLREASIRLGAEQTVALVTEASAAGALPAMTRLFPRYLTPLWRHSFGCALGARWLAERCGYPGLAEQAHLGGLLHDVGKWLLLALLERLCAGSERPALTAQLVEEVLESLHVELGERLAAAWHLPDDLVRVIGGHHRERPGDQALLDVVVRLADRGCHKLGLGWRHEPGLILPTTAEAQCLGLDELALAELEIMLEDRFGLFAPPPAS
jgi:HD-like signal output (HDOD) protein